MTTLAQISGVMNPWRTAQRPMSDELRWKNFPGYGQKLVEHNNALPIVLHFVLSHECAAVNDPRLLTFCAAVHDHGEPLSGGDEHIDAQTENKPVLEWTAYRKNVSRITGVYREQMQRAFLLAYVRKPKIHPMLTDHAQMIIQQLAVTHAAEAFVFEFTERMDYIFSALEGHSLGIRNDVETMLAHTLKNQVPRLDKLVEEKPSFAEIWSPVFRGELLELEA